MNAHKLTLGMGAVLFVMVSAGGVLQWETNRALRGELEALRAGLGLSPAHQTKNDRGPGGGPGYPASAETTRFERRELARLREEVNELRARTQALANQAVRAGAAPPLDLRPSSAWKNAGRGTPTAAAETTMWATDSGDVEALAGSIYLDQAARDKAEAILARMSDSMRADYNTPEKLVALLLAREGDIRAMQILAESKAGDDALVNLRLQKDDGKTKDEGYQFRRSADGWKLVVPGKAVDKMGKKLADPPKK